MALSGGGRYTLTRLGWTRTRCSSVSTWPRAIHYVQAIRRDDVGLFDGPVANDEAAIVALIGRGSESAVWPRSWVSSRRHDTA